MGILPTLNLTKFTSVAVGNVTVQPQTSTMNYGAVLQTKPTTGMVKGTLVPADTSVRTLVGLSTKDDQLTRTLQPSVKLVASDMINDPKFIVPNLTSKNNSIFTSYFQHITPKYVHRPASSNELAITTRKFEPYEQLTGISQERPEIVMMLPFMPLFNDEIGHSKPDSLDLVTNSGVNPFMTDAGRYVETQLNVRNLKVANVTKLLQATAGRNANLKKAYSKRLTEVERSVAQLKEITQFLLDLVNKTDILKNQLDLRDDIHRVDPNVVSTKFSSMFDFVKSNTLPTTLALGFKKFIPPSYTVADALAGLGYPAEHAMTTYSSTKMWLQMLLEYKHILLHHSLEFLDIEPSAQRNDTNAVSLTQPSARVFKLPTEDPVGIGFVSEIATTQPSDLRVSLKEIEKGYSFIYGKGSYFKTDEAKIAALANLISKEYKYAKGLTTTSLVNTLSQFYGYTVSDSGSGNERVFDQVVGQFGSNVFEFPSSINASLSSLAQQQPASNVAVLLFESKYLDGDNGILTPGAEFYVDSIFRATDRSFDTTALASLSKTLKNSYKSFSSFVNGMNLLNTTDSDNLDRNKNQLGSLLSNSSSMISFIYKSFLDKKGNTLPVIRNDRLASVYVSATKNPQLKAQLFYYTMSRILRSGPKSTSTLLKAIGFNVDNTSTIDALIDEILASLFSSTKENRSSLFHFNVLTTDANDIDDDSLKAALKQGTSLTTIVESFMSEMYGAIEDVSKNDRMIYSGQLNMVMLMVMFDMLLTMLGKVANQTFVSRKYGGKTGNKKNTYLVIKTNENHLNSVNDLVTRLDREIALTQKITYSVLNTLQKLGDATDGFVNYLTSPTARQQLGTISSIIPDQNLLQMLLSEQQIMLLGSNVFDLAGRMKTFSKSKPSMDFNASGQFDSEDEIKLLDDSVISPKLKNAVFGLLGTPEFVGSRAYNKRIISVGIPLGFTRRLKQRVSQAKMKRTSFANKQNDVIQIVVYKIDLLNQDIVFKPQRFLVELSRFPVRDDSFFKQLSARPTLEEIANAIPTRDWEESFEDGKSAVSYWNSRKTGKNSDNALDSETYDFLTESQKAQIIKNHVVSHVLETYVKLTTGISVAEPVFDLVEQPRLVDSEFVKLITENQLQNVIDFMKLPVAPPSVISSLGTAKNLFKTPVPTGGVLFSTTLQSVSSLHAVQSSTRTTNASGIAGKIDFASLASSITTNNSPTTAAAFKDVANLASSLDALSQRQIPLVIHALKTISSFTNTQTTLSDPTSLMKRMLTPKQFDRVFNVVVDPDEFEIDFVKTTQTEFGKEALVQLIKRSDILPASTTLAERDLKVLPLSPATITRLSRAVYKGSADPNLKNFRFRERNRSEGDLMFEKYFVTIETFGEEGV